MTLRNWWRLPQKRKACDLIGLGPFAPWLLVALLFYGLRRLEVWLHQHIFKLGWLVTNQYQTTTILYYAFFLPGILLNQLTVWMVAGFLNVRAARSIRWPEKQEIGELNLDFVQLSPKADTFRVAIISTAPLLVGLVIIWHIANNILNVPTFLVDLGRNSSLNNFATSAGQFTTAPDFWLWVYIAFTISNTMMPNFKNLRGWRILIGAAVVSVVVLYAVGAGNQVVMNNLRGPVTDSVNALSSVFAIIIGLDLFMVGVLGTLEAIFERVTGDSATFENGKMITMRRSEMLAQRAKALAAPQPKVAKLAPAPAGPPSVYKLLFSIPGAPGKEAVTHDDGIIITPDPNISLPAGSQPVTRSSPAVITGAITDKSLASDMKPAASLTPRTGGAPSFTSPSAPARLPAPDKDESEEELRPAMPKSPVPTGSPSAGGMQPTPLRPPVTSPSAGGMQPTRPATTSPSASGMQPTPTKPGSPAQPGMQPARPATTPPLAGGMQPTPTKPGSPLSPGMQPAKPASPFSSSPTTGMQPATPKSPVPSGTSGAGSMQSSSTRPGSPPAGGMQPTPTRPSGGTSPFAAPAGRPQTPASKPAFNIDDEDEDDFEEDEDEGDDGDVSYEDFEDPA